MILRVAVFAFVVALVGARSAVAAERSVMQPIGTYIAAANAGDRSALITAFTPDSEIVDEFSPYRFTAPHAAARWFDGFVADQRSSGVTDAVITVSPPRFATVTGTHAYVVVPTVYTYKVHGAPARESGSLVFSLVQRTSHWKIAAMSWAKLTDTSQL